MHFQTSPRIFGPKGGGDTVSNKQGQSMLSWIAGMRSRTNMGPCKRPTRTPLETDMGVSKW